MGQLLEKIGGKGLGKGYDMHINLIFFQFRVVRSNSNETIIGKNRSRT